MRVLSSTGKFCYVIRGWLGLRTMYFSAHSRDDKIEAF